jgi:heavy metal sensor kinase
MKSLTIQARLTAWYFLSFAVIVALFALSSWFAMRASMYHSIDRDLHHNIASVAPFIQKRSLNTPERFAEVFAGSPDTSIFGVFVQITDENAAILYESDMLRRRGVPALPPGKADGSIKIGNDRARGWPMRVVSQRMVVGGAVLTVHIVEPLHDVMESLREYGTYLAVLLPIALLLTTTAGYWMSRRALAPVEQIRREAEGIDPGDLATRLHVPRTDDEMARLASTLNAMLGRIEAGFRSIERFTADASHELRAPLAVIMTAGEVSLRRERTREELAEVLRKIVREARHMSRLIENLLDLARGDARQRHTEFVAVDLTDMLRDLGAEMSAAASAKGITLAVELDDVSVLGEGTELRRLFVILLDNAIKYTEAGSIRLALEATGAEATVRVQDTGIGIEQDALPHVFDRFWRADKVRSRAEGGAGLGLSLASQIVERHAGIIQVDSTLGQGSTFTVRLKVAHER